jgi:hypothetical protein
MGGFLLARPYLPPPEYHHTAVKSLTTYFYAIMSPESGLAVIICVTFYVPIAVGLRIYFNLRSKAPGARVWSTPTIIRESLFIIATASATVGLMVEIWIHIRYINLEKLPENERILARKDLNVIAFRVFSNIPT